MVRLLHCEGTMIVMTVSRIVRSRTVSWLALVGLLVSGVVLGSVAEAAEAFKLGVIDQQAVLERTKVGKRALEGLKEFSTTRQRIISSEDDELKGLEKELRELEAGSPPAGKKEVKQEQFRNRMEQYQRRIQQYNQEIQGKQREMAQEFQKKMQEATQAVAERAGYSLVLDSGSDATLRILLYYKDSVDVTDQVVKEFDARNK